MTPGFVVLLNGAPRAGKTSLARALCEEAEGIWINFGVDAMVGTLPDRLRPGIGLRPGGECPDQEAQVKHLYGGFFAALSAFSRQGINVAADCGIHDAYSQPLAIVGDAAALLEGLPLLFVGVYCRLEEIVNRRERSDPAVYAGRTELGEVAPPVLRWQQEVHRDHTYDLVIDTSDKSVSEGVSMIIERLGQRIPSKLFKAGIK